MRTVAWQGGGKREQREEKEEEEEKEDDEEEAEEKKDGERYTIRGHTISTEINQGCAQISKREITKINRPDIRRDKKRDSPFPFFLLSPFYFLSLPPPPLFLFLPYSARTGTIRRVTARARRLRVGFISITPIVPIKFPGDKTGTSLITARPRHLNRRNVDRDRRITR